MPAEVTHWLIARRAGAELTETPLGRSLAVAGPRADNWLLLGAVFHDALFYIPDNSPHLPYRKTADILHAEGGQDSFTVIRSLVASLGDPERDIGLDPALSGLLIGLAAHIFADANFHPFVYFHTGLPKGEKPSLSHRSTRAHYRLEALMDILFAGGTRAVRELSLSSILGPVRSSLAAPCQVIGRAFFPTEAEQAEFAAAMAAGFDRFARVQPIFQNRMASTLLHSVRHILPRQIREYSALGYSPLLARSLPLLHGRLGYRHPVTGAELTAKMEELFDKAVADTLALGRLAGELIQRGEPLPKEMIGPDLNGGLPGGKRNDLKHRAEKRLIKI